jgi:hypothetical protein
LESGVTSFQFSVFGSRKGEIPLNPPFKRGRLGEDKAGGFETRPYDVPRNGERKERIDEEGW